MPSVIYVAGPFRAPTAWLVEQNIRRAEAVALEMWQLWRLYFGKVEP